MGLSLSTRKRPTAVADGGTEIDTDILVTEMLLGDIQASNNTHIEKAVGSSRHPGCYVDQVNSLRDALQELNAKRSEAGRSSKRGGRKTPQVTADAQALLKRLAQAELDDHLAALALSRGEPLPAQTEVQKALADALLPDKAMVKDFLKKSKQVARAAAKLMRCFQRRYFKKITSNPFQYQMHHLWRYHRRIDSFSSTLFPLLLS